MDQTLDRLQFDLQLLRDRVTILEALVLPKTASVGERPTHPEPSTIVEPACPEHARPVRVEVLPALETELNLSAGMTTGARG
jgi:hypothetical protein